MVAFNSFVANYKNRCIILLNNKEKGYNLSCSTFKQELKLRDIKLYDK